MEKFLKKHYKWIIIILFILFLVKSMQSCMRQESIERLKSNYTNIIDSIERERDKNVLKLSDSISTQDDSIKLLNFKIELYKEKATSAERRAVAIQSTAEKIKAHTTVSIEREREDTTTKEKNIPKNSN